MPSPYHIHPSWLRVPVGAAAIVLLAAGCSLLIDAGRDQCSSDDDCTRIAAGGRCERGVCVVPSPALAGRGANDAGMDAGKDAGKNDAAMSMSEAGVGMGDGAVDGGMGDAGPQAPQLEPCNQSLDCTGTGETCFKKQCSLMRDVAPFVCEHPMPTRTDTVHFQMKVVEFVSEKPPKNVKVSACMINDVLCNAPVATFEDQDGTATVEMDVPFGFMGFLDVRSDDALPALWYFTLPLTEPRTYKPLKVVAPGTADLLAAFADRTVDMDKGIIVLEAFDCALKSVGGIHFEESKNNAVSFYIVNSTPSVESKITVRDETTDTAPGGFLNAEPGFTVFRARIGLDGPVIGEFNGHVRAGTVTYLDIYP